ncbi:hypothetical protein [Nodosilinea sp. FACHB-13]|uniref:hypothetical protein n=1 Tax=Cyanophyceae TaxID=3028117 RepID=UPI0016875043|nr:hypothetical protein [Nodosilinea sp. FACHB-13]MBD2106693.1 hypothetical protein [Nodosilinea sp. FACHB-13]
MIDPTLLEIIARLEGIEAQQPEDLTLLKHGVTPPEWVSAKALAEALGLGPRAADYWRKDLGVISILGAMLQKLDEPVL